ncbi:hypothetical protein D3C79_433630 [compost metagenome]
MGAQGQFAFEHAATNAGNLRQQVGGAFLERLQRFEGGIKGVFLLGEYRALRGDVRLARHQGFNRGRAEHLQLRAQLCLLRQERSGQAVDIDDQRLQSILRAFELVVVVGLGNLLLEAVQAQLQGLQVVLGHLHRRNCSIGRRRRWRFGCLPEGKRLQQGKGNDADDLQSIAHGNALYGC